MYTADVPFPVLSRELWWGDSWDPRDYGRDFDFSRPFFEQFRELDATVPHPPLALHLDENSDYCNNAGEVKNCYLVFNTNKDEDCSYSETIPDCTHCIDLTRCSNCAWSYDCVECSDCHNLQSSEGCQGCSDSVFLLNCRSCSSCFGCVNLRQARYCIFNEQYSKEEYELFIRNADLGSFKSRETHRAAAESFFRKHPRPNVVVNRVEGVTGNFLFDSRNVHDSYSIRGGDELRYSFLIYLGAKSCWDLTMFGEGAELMYECLVCGLGSFNLRFSSDCWRGSSDLDYCILCIGSRNLFGCVAMRQRSFCILNKQYSQKDYEALVPKIVDHMRETGEWGEFFPIPLSSVPYNRSMAQRYFPLSREQVSAAGWRWYDRDAVEAKNAILAAQLPDRLPEEHSALVVQSAENGRPFRITAEEIKLYRKLEVPLPRIAYDERMEQRQRQLGPIDLKATKCAKTGKSILSPFGPDSGWIIWDRDEYEKEFSS